MECGTLGDTLERRRRLPVRFVGSIRDGRWLVHVRIPRVDSQSVYLHGVQCLFGDVRDALASSWHELECGYTVGWLPGVSVFHRIVYDYRSTRCKLDSTCSQFTPLSP